MQTLIVLHCTQCILLPGFPEYYSLTHFNTCLFTKKDSLFTTNSYIMWCFQHSLPSSFCYLRCWAFHALWRSVMKLLYADLLSPNIKPDSHLICHMTVTRADLNDDDCYVSEMHQHNLTHSSLNLHCNGGLTVVPNAIATAPWPCHRCTSDSITLTSAGAWTSLPVLLL